MTKAYMQEEAAGSAILSEVREKKEEHMASNVSIVHTVEGMAMAVEDFGEHVDHCNVSFKQNLFEKIKALKQNDTSILTERVEELKG